MFHATKAGGQFSDSSESGARCDIRSVGGSLDETKPSLLHRFLVEIVAISHYLPVGTGV
ncbi:hypothetical protein ZHAS_00022242 [Anopheles sinensis]|uniref:Uncharacterized protein n=1 Tax=Anopheles sinensis TaxID=74873 RepID=A0A084WUU6_ANOSI|nr:hypothetical protein ZHAS_00022242 [Anopheles sinensis]